MSISFTIGIGLFQPYIGPLGFGSSQCSGNNCQFNSAPNTFTNGIYICDGAERTNPDNAIFMGFGQYQVPSVYACGCGMSVNDVAAKNGHGSVNPTLCPSGCDLYVEPAPAGLQCNTVQTCSYGGDIGESGSQEKSNCVSPPYYLNGDTSTVVTLDHNEGDIGTYNCTGDPYPTGDSCLLGDSSSIQETWCSCSGATGPSPPTNPCNLVIHMTTTSTSPVNPGPSQPIISSTTRLLSTSSTTLLTVLVFLPLFLFQMS